jgi:hypothetical protein
MDKFLKVDSIGMKTKKRNYDSCTLARYHSLAHYQERENYIKGHGIKD